MWQGSDGVVYWAQKCVSGTGEERGGFRHSDTRWTVWGGGDGIRQGASTHCCASVVALHAAPPNSGCVATVRVRVSVPLPHVTLQAQSLHSDMTHSTAAVGGEGERAKHRDCSLMVARGVLLVGA